MESINETPKQEAFNQRRLHDISEAYGLGELSFVASPESGIITENAILEDENGRKYFAKHYQAEDGARHAATYRASEIVATDERIPVVLPLLSQDGSYTVAIDGASFALFDYVEHDTEAIVDLEQMEQLVFNTAQMLGRIHAVPVNPSETLLRPIDRLAPDAGQKRIDLLKKLIRLIEDKEVCDEFDQLAIEEARFKLSTLEEMGEPPVADVSTVICHADFHDKNVLHDKDMNIIAVCDWDNAGLANPYIDFLDAFNKYVIRGNTHSPEEEVALARAFISGYKAGLESQINHEALEVTYQSFVRERIGSTWPMYQHYYENDTKNDRMLADRSDQIRKLAENPNKMLDLIRNSVTSN